MARTAEHLSASSTPDSRFPPEEAFAALATRTDQMQVMIDSLPVLISYIDPQQHYQFANATYSQWFTPQGGSVVGLHMRDVLGHSVYETVRPYVEAALAGEPTRYEADVDFKAAGVMVVDTQIVPHFGRDGTVVGAYELVSDITDQIKAETSLQFTQFAVDKGAVGAMWLNDDGRICYANDVSVESLGYSRDALLQMTVSDIDPQYPAYAFEQFFEHLRANKTTTFQTQQRRKNGSLFPVEVTARYMAYDGIEYCCAFTQDISERKRAELALQASEDRFRRAFEDAAIGMALANEDSVIVDVNRAVCDMLGYTREELVGKCFSDITHPDDAEKRFDFRDRMFPQDGQSCELENRYICKDGSTIWAQISASAVSYPNEHPHYAIVQIQDITEARQLSEQLTYQASHDALTGLTNRRAFESRLEYALDRLDDDSVGHVVAYIDLDQFKVINDTCGHAAGDELLRQLGQVLSAALRSNDILARLGGDEFGILLENCSVENAQNVVDKLHAAISEYRFVWEDKLFNIGASVGLVPIVQTATINQILSEADSACYTAKDQGRNRTHVSSKDDQMLARRLNEMEWIAKINHALENNRLRLHYQTIVPLGNEGSGDHYELLVRMVDSDGKLVPPGAFLPAAERYNLSAKLDSWVIETALSWLHGNAAALRNLGLVSINLSGQTVSDEKMLILINDMLDNSDVPAERICFEVTETAAIANLATATHFIETLRKRGCKFALDDFGSGLSSFAYLKTLPVDYLKIDGVFVKDMINDPFDLAMVKSIKEPLINSSIIV